LDAATGALHGTPLASGVYEVRISVTNELATTQADVEITVYAPTWAAWQGQHFTTQELGDSRISGRASDPDGDGVPNLFEYLFGKDPFIVDCKPPALRVSDGRLTLTYDVLRAVAGWAVIPEYSADLQTWKRGASYVETLKDEILDARRRRITVGLSNTLINKPTSFFRVVAEENP
jgi:hypothetical protein